jgi:hypothetical protein
MTSVGRLSHVPSGKKVSKTETPKLEFPKTSFTNKINMPHYSTPSSNDLAVIIPFFNPTKSFRIIQNVLLSTSLLRAGNIPFFIAELSTDDTPFIFPSNDNVFQYRTSSYMFYKENLFAAAEKRIPESFTKLLLIDSDILFGAKDWYDQLSKSLDTIQVIQPFHTAHWLNASFSPFAKRNSVLLKDAFEKHTGFAWAFQRNWYKENGIFEYALIGGGDSLFYYRAQNIILEKFHESYIADFNDLKLIEKPSIGFLNVDVYHLFHGALSNRQYDIRHKVLGNFLKSRGVEKLSTMVERNDDGIFEWAPTYREECNKLLLSYFNSRNDDGL